MPFALRERTGAALAHAAAFSREMLPSPRYWGVIAAAALLLGLIGPFGTFERVGLARRLVYWTATMAGTSVVAILVLGLVAGFAASNRRLTLPVLLFGAVASCVPNTWLVQALVRLLLREPAPSFAVQFLFVLPIGIAVSLVVWLVFSRDRPDEAPPNPLLERLPVAKRGPVVRMSAEDHYVSVVTTRGRELVLMPLRDAEAAMGQAGLRIHRSHWVSRDHVAATRREGAGAVVTTTDGAELPVSRGYVAKLKEAGLLP